MELENREREKPILVTGLNRAGTTWVGKMIATSPTVGYIHEPFNLSCHPGICNARFKFWFSYVSYENEADIVKAIRRTLDFKINLADGLKATRSLKDLLVLKGTVLSTYRKRRLNLTPLMKDPVAVFSAEWLASRFNMDVIVMIRHPAAYVSSINRLNWPMSFIDLLNQPVLMRELLYPFESEIRAFASKPKGEDVIGNAILSWKIMFHVINIYMKRHPEWSFLRHEDVSADPIGHFADIFRKLRLCFSENVMDRIREYTDSSNSNKETGATCIKRDSKSNIWVWKNRLSISQIGRIRNEIGDISDSLYSDEDW